MTKVDYEEFAREHRRLAILKLLFAAPGYRENSRVLHRLLHQRGHVASLDAINGDLAWLDEQGLVSAERLEPQLSVAVLSARGADVAAARTRVPGVARPGPGE